MSKPAINIGRLNRDQRLALIEDLWESLTDDARSEIPLTSAQQEELDRRLDAPEPDGTSGIPSEELHERIKYRSS